GTTSIPYLVKDDKTTLQFIGFLKNNLNQGYLNGREQKKLLRSPVIYQARTEGDRYQFRTNMEHDFLGYIGILYLFGQDFQTCDFPESYLAPLV
ncbi:MAG: hypothetical protein JXA44_12025, partial [Methanospirillaceae archaeon]|nr:hypothetical protein [Methanospirillaceae archaeon]